MTLAMTEAQRQLYEKIQNFALDEPEASFPLSRRLARENGWSQEKVERAIAEYKKFAFLAVVAGHPVSPSDAVDQVWHLHLLYTHSYWERFCGDVLGQPLHHMPTLGGLQEQEKFEDWYAKTLESYERFFGHPSMDLWPTPAEKLAKRTQYQWVDRIQHWVIPKPSQWRQIAAQRLQRWDQSVSLGTPVMRWTMVFVGAFLLWTLSAEAAFAQTVLNPLNFRGPEFLGLYSVLSALCFGGANGVRFFSQRATGNPTVEPTLDLYESAYLAEGERRTVETAIAKLAMAEVIAIDERGRASLLEDLETHDPETNPPETSGPDSLNLEAFSHPLEQAIIGLLKSDSFSIRGLLGQIQVNHAMQDLRDGLLEQELLMSPEQTRSIQTRSALVMALPLPVGICKIFVGMARMKPVGFLEIFCLLIAVAAGLILIRAVAHRTGQGDRLFKQMQRQQKATTVNPASEEMAVISQAFALHGSTALTGTAYACLVPGLTYVPTYGNLGGTFASSCGGGVGGGCGSSCGSSCGGGCGGGCGGCGG